MSAPIICKRSSEFAIRIIKLCDRIAPRSVSARHVASQLVRCGTSIGSNAEEAQEGSNEAGLLDEDGRPSKGSARNLLVAESRGAERARHLRRGSLGTRRIPTVTQDDTRRSPDCEVIARSWGWSLNACPLPFALCPDALCRDQCAAALSLLFGRCMRSTSGRSETKIMPIS